MEKNYDPRAVLSEIFNYTTCERPDGSWYGIADGKMCRQGTQVSAEDIHAATKSRSTRVASTYANVALDRDFADSISGTVVSAEQLQETQKLLDETSAKLREKMDSNQIESELKDFVENRKFSGDVSTASVIVVGMEEAARGTESGEAFDKFLSTRLAEDIVKRNRPELSAAVDTLKPSERISAFHTQHAMLLGSAGNTVSSTEIAQGVGKVAQLEFRAMPASAIKSWELGDRPYAKGTDFSSRKQYEKTYDKKMAANAVKQIVSGAKNNPNLNTVVLAGGKNDKNSEAVFNALSKIPGSKTDSVSFKVPQKGKEVEVQGRIIDIGGKGKTFAYDYGRSVNSFGFNSTQAKFNTGQAFYSKRVQMAQTRKAEIKDLNQRIRTARQDGREGDVTRLKATLKEIS